MEFVSSQYKIYDTKLGSGGFSEVFLGLDTIAHQHVAIKKVPLKKNDIMKGCHEQDDMLEKLNFEVNVMKKLTHTNIVNYLDVIKTKAYWYIIMEYCSAGTLHDVIEFNKAMSYKSHDFNREANSYYYLNQLKDALDYIRKEGYAHRDIKPMNVLLASPYKSGITISARNKQNLNYTEGLIVKLADFGLAKYHPDTCDELMDTMCGSPLYMAPELIIDQKYNSKADLWSYGIIMYQLLFGVHPNGDATNRSQLINNLKQRGIDFHLDKKFTTECFDLLMKLLIKDYTARIGWNDLFNHKWFSYWKEHIDDNDMSKTKLIEDIGSVSDIDKKHQKTTVTKSISRIKLSDTSFSNSNKSFSDKSLLESSTDDSKLTLYKPNTKDKQKNYIHKEMSTKKGYSRYILKNEYQNSNFNSYYDENSMDKSISSSSVQSKSSNFGQCCSNLSKMKIDKFYPHKYALITYSDYLSGQAIDTIKNVNSDIQNSISYSSEQISSNRKHKDSYSICDRGLPLGRSNVINGKNDMYCNSIMEISSINLLNRNDISEDNDNHGIYNRYRKQRTIHRYNNSPITKEDAYNTTRLMSGLHVSYPHKDDVSKEVNIIKENIIKKNNLVSGKFKMQSNRSDVFPGTYSLDKSSDVIELKELTRIDELNELNESKEMNKLNESNELNKSYRELQNGKIKNISQDANNHNIMINTSKSEPIDIKKTDINI